LISTPSASTRRREIAIADEALGFELGGEQIRHAIRCEHGQHLERRLHAVST